MTYPQVRTYPLTFAPRGNYAESLNDTYGFRTRQICDIFVSLCGWMRAENNQYQPAFMYRLSESTLYSFLKGISKRIHKMTILSDTYGVYTNLRQIFNSYNPENYDKDTEEVNTAMCGALCELETAMAYLPIEDKADRKLKLKLLKQSLSLAAERADGTIDLDNLSATAREQLTMALQLIKE